MDDVFASPKRRLERARNRISELGDIIVRYWEGPPYKPWRERHPDGKRDVHSIRFYQAIPAICEDVAAEALLALRSGLDQAGYAAAVASGKTKPRSTYFPICHKGSAVDLDNLIKKNCVDLPPEIQALFRGCNAYNGGNAVLCTLNEMRNAVHTVFAPNVVSDLQRKLHIPSTKHAWVAANPPVWDRVKNEIVYLWTPRDADVPHEIDFTFTVSFADVEHIRNVPAVDVLNAMATEVQRVLANTENECRRLGLIP